jgi:lysyl-tRNA synthetase class 2
VGAKPLSEKELIEARKKNLEKLKEAGVELYPRKYEWTHTISEVCEKYSDASAEQLSKEKIEVKISGRIMSLRPHGKAGFAHLSSSAVQLQIYCRADILGEKSFNLFKYLDVGDIIGVKGYLFRTRTGELTVMAEELTFLSKALRPLPEKWHGLSDVEVRYRQRYLDLIMNPEVRKKFIIRSHLLHEFRNYLNEHGFIEVETPMMQPLAGGANARPFETYHNALGMKLFLRIAPELYLKRLTVGGLDKVYEINRNFRNEGIDKMHNPEFTMLEFYWAYIDYHDVMAFTEKMLHEITINVLGSSTFMFDGKEIDMSPPWQRVRIKDAIAQRANIKAEELDNPQRIKDLAKELDINFEQHTTPGKALMEIFERLVEPYLIEPTFITEFPLEVSPLSKTKKDDPKTVERFEIFIGGLEVANGFSELNDPADQRRRFEMQLEEKEKGDEEAHVMDEDYIMALEYGMPPAGGEGIGIDRMTMLFTDSHNIREVILFPQLRLKKEK